MAHISPPNARHLEKELYAKNQVYYVSQHGLSLSEKGKKFIWSLSGSKWTSTIKKQ